MRVKIVLRRAAGVLCTTAALSGCTATSERVQPTPSATVTPSQEPDKICQYDFFEARVYVIGALGANAARVQMSGNGQWVRAPVQSLLSDGRPVFRSELLGAEGDFRAVEVRIGKEWQPCERT